MSSCTPDAVAVTFGAPLRLGRLVSVGIAALLMNVAATSSSHAAQSIFDACSESLAKYCADVTPGNGHLLTCLYSHEDKVSDACDLAFTETGDIIDMLFETLRSAKRHCQGDISQLCADAAVGGGEVLRCLVDNRASLSEGCGGVVDKVVLPAN
jgi:hypothetical protein